MTIPLILYDNVSAFTLGDWIQDFLVCYKQLQANTKQQDIREEYDSEKVAVLKNKFDIE